MTLEQRYADAIRSMEYWIKRGNDRAAANYSRVAEYWLEAINRRDAS